MIDDRGENVDTLIIGSGFAGATVARILAERGEKVKIIEKRPHMDHIFFIQMIKMFLSFYHVLLHGMIINMKLLEMSMERLFLFRLT